MNAPAGMELAAAILERYEREQRRWLAYRMQGSARDHLRLVTMAEACRAMRYRLAADEQRMTA